MLLILLLFADDMAILGKTPEDLQNSLDSLYDYCNCWGLEVNTKKTKVMVFRKRGRVLPNEKWSYHGNLLETVDNFNYLVTIFNYTGNFAMNQEHLIGKSLKALKLLMYNCRKYNI